MVFRSFIAVTHINSTARLLLRAPEEVFNKLLRHGDGAGCAVRYPGAIRAAAADTARPAGGSGNLQPRLYV